MTEKTYSMSMYASKEDLLADKCKDQQEKIQRLESEIESQSKAYGLLVAENAELHQQLEFKVSEGTKRLVDRCAKAEEENAELRQTLERLEDQHKKNQADLAGCILTHKADAEHIEKLERHCKELLEEKAELRREVERLSEAQDRKLKEAAESDPALYMSFVTQEMLILYT